MKKYAFWLFVSLLTFTSCSLEDDGTQNFYFEVVPIDSVEAPEQFVLGQTHEILITYTTPNSCYIFNDFIYNIDGYERTVAVVNTVYTSDSCSQEENSVTVSLNFKPTTTETYVFKFFQGTDVAQGTDEYYVIEIPVVEQ